MLRRLKSLGATVTELLDVYEKQALTKLESKQIERKISFSYYTWQWVWELWKCFNSPWKGTPFREKTQTMSKICKEEFKNPKFKDWFCPSNPGSAHSMNTRNCKITYKLKPVQTRTTRFENSPIPFLTKLLNNL